MNKTELLSKLLQGLDEGAPRRGTLELYYRGEQPLAFLAPEAKAAIGSRFGKMSTNIPRIAVNALAERLRVAGFRSSTTDTAQLWQDWQRCDMDQLSPLAHREALTLGESFVIVWADAQGRPQVSIESPTQVAVVRDPASRQVIAAVKRWTTASTTEATLFEPDTVTRYSANTAGATITGFKATEVLPNPYGVVPVVPLRNSDRLLGCASSEMDDLLPLVDGLNKLLADLMVASEYSGRPRRWATGIELEEAPVLDADGNDTGETVAVNPYPDANRMMINESPDGKFGQLSAADLASYEAAVRVLQAQISAVSGLPPHYLGAHGDQPASADAMRAAEASLTAKAEARQQVFGTAWEQVARLMVATRTGQDPAAVELAVSWADPATRSVAQEADAIVKLHTSGLLPASYALKRLGYSDDQVTAIRQARRAEALDTSGTDLAGILGGGR